MFVIVRILLAAAGLAFAGVPAAAAPTIGIVLMHGINGIPFGTTGPTGRATGGALVDALHQAGYIVDTPEMCWSHRRIYDEAFTDCFADLDAAIARLKAHGATAIVVGGQSMGGNTALGYAATHAGVIGVIACAPAHDAATLGRIPVIAAALRGAKAAIGAGHGDDVQTFPDRDNARPGGPAFTVQASAKAYVSFIDPGGPANIRGDLGRIRVPVVWVAGTQDPSQRTSADEFARIPANPLNRYVSVQATHLETPDAGAGAIVDWLNALSGAQKS